MLFVQIIEEELPFPSGTATAHLISVLHQLPPPESNLRQRRGYQHIENGEEITINEATINDMVSENEEEVEHEREVVEHQGWHDLIWSFAASGLLTVILQRVLSYAIILINPSSSWQHFSIPFCSQFHYLETTWRRNGYGTSLRVYRMLAKVRPNFSVF